MEPRIALNGQMWTAQDLSRNPFIAAHVIMETSWTSLAYGFGAMGDMAVYDRSGSHTMSLDRLYEDAVALSLGIFTIDMPHEPCKRLICNCKIQ